MTILRQKPILLNLSLKVPRDRVPDAPLAASGGRRGHPVRHLGDRAAAGGAAVHLALAAGARRQP